jgi:signal peptidase I
MPEPDQPGPTGPPLADPPAPAAGVAAGPPGAPPGSALPSPAGTPPPQKRRGSTRRTLIEWGAIVVVAVLAALLLRAFVVQPYYIPSGSMEPTLHVGDKVLVNKLSYNFHPVHRGDIVVFKTPPDDNSPGIKDLIKRVIGLPGETIWSGPSGAIFINGRQLSEPWLSPEARANPGPPIQRMVIPAGDYFVMGDNRSNSTDSRMFGPISKGLIVGRAFLRVWPLSRLGTL